ncbi:hypothetical protein DTO013E5_5140 [Penicillium roqueforti]|uniref:Carbohydrate-binding WSC n=1 Tax=Penicillium roqueforti (strain FM164) TaxID=1365484 RepID=W6PZ33_PENRF|nr:uncharacterized protein LCP9604111_5611 [Penicillium roqueforti]CDM29533.1 Carbohydrate-binding WSC [Penicillium roqueforti FM164]KAF9248356.1 hypothetical protein LCP9604111_5611 [Penicillium roqueforti]KAI1836214.1 hypothetical protein CBS147337_3363 [Penicillium roqueforti]KAI2679993.1 hypothetical protein LCP963914a_7083 [Penicillium roqueforti]KAI2683237.1 hypothetical protein CBS147355_2377 [Penicillium roqueforti]
MKVAVVVSVFALLARPFVSASSDLAYCATENTGSSFTGVSNTFQSNGLCETTCTDYAFAILQGSKCWCSNVAPAKSSLADDTSDCDGACPGYPADSCGSTSKGVYAYVEVVGNDATSTAAGTTTSKTTSSTSTSTKSTSTSTSTTSSTSDPPVTVTVTASDSTTTSTTTSTSPISTSSDDKTTTSLPTVSVQTNSGGQVKTITVSGASATSGADSASPSTTTSSKSKLSGGSIAGVVIGVLGGLALVGALIFLIFFYRKRARSVSPIPSQDMADDRSRGSSFMGGFFPRSDNGSLPSRTGTTFTDRRMKTNTVLYPNGHRDSSVSLQDNEDYSRPVLRLTNPD